jgi:hypothetical protein
LSFWHNPRLIRLAKLNTDNGPRSQFNGSHLV